MSVIFVIITVAVGVLDHEHYAPFMLISGLLLGVTMVCCFCMNFRRSRMIDWELPHAAIHRFAVRWSRKRLGMQLQRGLKAKVWPPLGL